MKDKNVLISMSAGIKSLVAAYVLKKQGMNVTGAHIKIPSLDGKSFSLRSTCHLEDDSQVKSYCEQLKIPYVKIDGSEYYQDFVVRRLIAAKLSGETFNPCIYCNELRIDLLLKKADEMGIHFISTGHMAQVSKTPGKESYQIFEDYDLKNDQSYFLSGLNSDQLERAIFPLGKLGLEEITKIAKTLLGKIPTNSKRKICHIDDPLLPKYIESKTPESLREKGPITEYHDDLPLGEHDGIYKYHLGQDHIKCEYAEIESSYHIVSLDPNKKEIKVSKNPKIENSVFFLKNFIPNLDLDISKPMEVLASFKPYTLEIIPCKLFFHNNDQVHIETEKPITEFVANGTPIVFHNNVESGRKIIGRGVVFKTLKKLNDMDVEFRL